MILVVRNRRIFKCFAVCIFVVYVLRLATESASVVRNHGRDLTDEEIRNLVTIRDMPNITLLKTLFNLTNPGHLGSPVMIDPERLPNEERLKYDRSKKENGYHNYVSNLISIHRKTPLAIPEECQTITYDITHLPQTSVVVIFMNETWVTLLRTVHSIIDNTPQSLLKEIVLVDDNSTHEHLLKPLEDYMSRYPIVRIIRTGERVGLTRARIIGFDASTAPTVTFMDCHCECFPRWLEPQLERIASDDKIVTTPIIENVHMENFGIANVVPWVVAGFALPLSCMTWIPMPDREKKRRKSQTDPILSPGMAGGLFTISRKWFEHLGKYDPGLLIWGGENMELSLKVWMCGGSIESIPCSKVGHVYRSHPNYHMGEVQSAMTVNMGRVAAVWMDDYKTFHRNWNGSVANLGDISQRVKLRESLQCNSFQWYLDHVHPEFYITGIGVYAGEIRNVQFPSLCLDGNGIEEKLPIIAYTCHGEGPQFWDFSDLREIRNMRHCLDYSNHRIEKRSCRYGGVNQVWRYEDGQIMTDLRNKCVAIDNDLKEVVLQDCDGGAHQKWQWKWMREPRKV